MVELLLALSQLDERVGGKEGPLLVLVHFVHSKKQWLCLVKVAKSTGRANTKGMISKEI